MEDPLRSDNWKTAKLYLYPVLRSEIIQSKCIGNTNSSQEV